MKILFVASECAPFSKSGGLADVASSLPPALKKLGHDIDIVTPYYQCVNESYSGKLKKIKKFEVIVGDHNETFEVYKGKHGLINIYFLKNNGLFNRPHLYGYDDDKYRFAFFSKACVDFLKYLNKLPDIIHTNDWETAPVIFYLKDYQAMYPECRNIRTVYTIHNIAYQGQFGKYELWNTFGLVEEWYETALKYLYEGREDINLMKGAMIMADAVSTVSKSYSHELHNHEFGMGLEGVADIIRGKMYGILNGIDMKLYNPKTDKRLVANFDRHDMTGKYACKYYIQEQFGLKKEKEWPLFSSVARLVEQKGIELIKEVLPGLMDLGIQVIIFGDGDQQYVDYFNEMKKKYPGQFGFSNNYNEEMAVRVFAGSDFYLMPSRFEPCGLSQMMAMRYGAVPIVHATGGLKDSIRPYSEFDGIGDGFSFSKYTSKALYLSCLQAIKLYFADRKTYRVIRDRCFRKDFSWKKSAEIYEKMYSDIYTIGTDVKLEFADAFKILKEAYMSPELAAHRTEYLSYQEDEFRTILQVNIEGQGQGIFSVIFDKNGITMEPRSNEKYDVLFITSFENLLRMAKGELSSNKLYISGRLKIRGNMSKAAELRYMLETKDISESL
ncbi:MAG: glycogen/starch synthase [Bacilli bacterium]|nr:glycogen/starch synthase [Bacilli bacterium]